MAADIHAVALEADGARDAADLLARLEENWLDLRAPLDLDGGGKSGGACSDDDCRALLHGVWKKQFAV